MNYETPDAIDATELPWPIPTIQKLWFGNVQDDKQKRIHAFLSCMHCDELPHGNLPPHLLLMACVLRYAIFDHEPRSNRGLKNCSVVVVVVVAVQFQYFLN